MVTIACEQPGALDVIRWCVEHGVLAAIGHTDADADTTRRAIDAGATTVNIPDTVGYAPDFTFEQKVAVLDAAHPECPSGVVDEDIATAESSHRLMHRRVRRHVHDDGGGCARKVHVDRGGRLVEPLPSTAGDDDVEAVAGQASSGRRTDSGPSPSDQCRRLG